MASGKRKKYRFFRQKTGKKPAGAGKRVKRKGQPEKTEGTEETEETEKSAGLESSLFPAHPVHSLGETAVIQKFSGFAFDLPFEEKCCR